MTNQQLSDPEPATQSAAYWTGAAHAALMAFIRARRADLGFTEAQHWLLRLLSAQDLSPDGRGLTVPELRQALRAHLGPGADPGEEAATLVELGWLRGDDAGRLWITEAGEAARADLAEHAPAVRERILRGIDDADWATTVRVLHQLIRNVGGRLA
ncbi:MarR family transcriptional regulator [Kitasatospora sp. NPDC090091]|uniref:MarR family transcriptional regulator n=1 Tax=Kitasatospora sp. NPDC090091 TaxID=3364081 RepID=UPI0037F3A523